MRAMTEYLPPFISFDLLKAKYDSKSQTYDVTKLVTGMYSDVFSDLQEYLNFTSTVHKRKDGKWGPTTVLANGTVLAFGITESLTSGFAEVIVTGYVLKLICNLVT